MTYNISNTKNLRIYGRLPNHKARLEYMTAGHVTVATLTQVEGNRLIRHYVAKIRGIVIGSNKSQWKFDTPEEARMFGKKTMAKWRAELEQIQKETRGG